MADEYRSRFASPVSKLLRFFEKSRESWRARAVAADQRVAELEREIEQLKFGL